MSELQAGPDNANGGANAPILSIENLTTAFRSGDSEVVAAENVSLHVDKGETLAIVGESGSGKSVTALSILRLLPYPAAVHKSGRILFDGQDLLTAKESALRAVRGRRIGMVFQEPMTSLNPLHTIEKQIAEVLYRHKTVPAEKVRERVLELLNLVGIPNPEQRLSAYPHEMSGGQRQRVMIAMALANEPEVLIADEPTTALDVTIQAQILDLLKDLQARFGMALLLITHDFNVVRRMADRIIVMNKGQVVEQAPCEALFENPQHPYTRALLAAEPKGQADPPDPTAEPVLETRQLKVHFPIKKGMMRKTVDVVKAVDGIDITVRRGQTLGVVGESGSGKTTLGLAILRLIASQGDILFRGKDMRAVNGKALRALRQDMQMVFQDPFGSLSPRMSVGDIISEGLRVHRRGMSAREREESICAILDEVGLDPVVRHRYPHEFSGGQRQRISIARAMILNPHFVVLDEPTSALDLSVQAQIVELLKSLQQKHGLAYLFISHDLKVVRALANEVVVMRHGHVVERGPVAQIFESPQDEYTKTLIEAAFV